MFCPHTRQGLNRPKFEQKRVAGVSFLHNPIAMQVKQKSWEQFIPLPLDRVWAFFSRPENLNAITPDDVSFEMRTDLRGIEMYEGMLIQYDIRPLLGIKMRWVTEITHIREGAYFIDEQRFGPYAFWHHQHHFEAREGGTLMRDILHYKVPYGIIGTLADTLLVDGKIEEIFAFRVKAVNKMLQEGTFAAMQTG